MLIDQEDGIIAGHGRVLGAHLLGLEDEFELGELFAERTQGRTNPDDAPEPPAHPVAEPGDLWVLGRHRLLCGDTAYGRINSTWTLPNQVGWPIAKELLFSARVVEAEEAYRIGLLNHLVPREQLRAKTMELARMIAGNNRASVIGIKALLLDQMGQNLEQQWNKERHYTTHVVRGAKAEEAFPEFIARRGRPLS